MDVIDQKNDEFENCYKHHLLSTAGHKIPHTYRSSVILKSTNQNYLRHGNAATLTEWENMHTASARGPIVNPPFRIELTME